MHSAHMVLVLQVCTVHKDGEWRHIAMKRKINISLVEISLSLFLLLSRVRSPCPFYFRFLAKSLQIDARFFFVWCESQKKNARTEKESEREKEINLSDNCLQCIQCRLRMMIIFIWCNNAWLKCRSSDIPTHSLTHSLTKKGWLHS